MKNDACDCIPTCGRCGDDIFGSLSEAYEELYAFINDDFRTVCQTCKMYLSGMSGQKVLKASGHEDSIDGAVDVITDLLHYAALHGASISNILRRVKTHFNAESDWEVLE